MTSARFARRAGTRRIEAVGLRDVGGAIWLVGLLDTTLERDRSCVLVESPPPGLDAAWIATIASAARRAIDECPEAHPGAWCVALEVEPASGELRRLACASRLPHGFAALEAVTGLDLAELAGALAAGGRLAGEPPPPRDHAALTCLATLDAENELAPRGGVVDLLRLPTGSGLRVESAVEEGSVVDAERAPALARLVGLGRTREKALARLRRALAQTLVAVRGGATDKAFLATVLARPEVAAGTADAAWLDGLVERGEHLPRRGAEIALLQAALVAYEAELGQARARFFDAAAHGRPEVSSELGRRIELRHRGATYRFHVAKLEPQLYRIAVDDTTLEVRIERTGHVGQRLLCAGASHATFYTVDGRGLLCEVDGLPHRVVPDAGDVVRAPAPAVVVSVVVAEGDEIVAGAPLVVLEAMKMETTLRAEVGGRVRKVLVRRNAQVMPGAPLVVLEPTDDRRPAVAPPDERLSFAALRPADDRASDAGAPSAWHSALCAARRLLLGYELDPRRVRDALVAAAIAGDADAAGEEEDVLALYADLAALGERRSPAEAADGDDRRSAEEYLLSYLREPDARGLGLPEAFLGLLRRAVAHWGIERLERTPELEECLFRLTTTLRRLTQLAPLVIALLERRRDRHELGSLPASASLRTLLDRLVAESREREPTVHDLAREVRYRVFDQPLLVAERERLLAAAEDDLAALERETDPAARARRVRALVECPQPLHAWLSERFAGAAPARRQALLEVMVRRYYRARELVVVAPLALEHDELLLAEYEHLGSQVRLLAAHAQYEELGATAERLRQAAARLAGPDLEIVADLYLWRDRSIRDGDAEAATLEALANDLRFPVELRRLAVSVSGPDGVTHFTFRRDSAERLAEERLVRGLHPMVAHRLQLWRLANFHLERLPSPNRVYLFRGVAREPPAGADAGPFPQDERLFALAEVRDLTPQRDATGRVLALPQLERRLTDALAGIRHCQAARPAGSRLHWNRVLLYVWPPVMLTRGELQGIVRRLAPEAAGLGLEKVQVRCRLPRAGSGELEDWVLEIANPGEGALLRFRRPAATPLKPLRDYAQKVVELRRRGLLYPYEVVKLLAPGPAAESTDIPAGEFVEHDLDARGRLVPVDRPYGQNSANVVVGTIRNFTERYPEGMTRVLVLGDASRGMGALAEPECRRVVEALDLAAQLHVPLEWIALSAGARIAMDSGTENMDWIARVLRKLVELTQKGLEVNLVVPGINVGAQPYWNAEATMLMHTKGILVMTPDGAMVLTGKQALDYSGGVSAEDNLGIGGFERIMGPNGQAQYFARDVPAALRILMAHYEHAYVAPGERFPRPARTTDPRDRDVRDHPHGGEFATVGEVLSNETNPGRKRPFDIRRVMSAVADRDHPPLERWFAMRDAEIGVVWDAHLGGWPVCLLGFESKPLPRLDRGPAYGPDVWTAGTLFPQASKKIARAINAASGVRPLVVLANLSGFDGSPESMRQCQLEYGAEIGRAVVNFRGPIVFVVISRYHGGAFVVFSAALHDDLQVAAVEGTYASVIGGAPAAAVVFAREVDKRTRRDPRVAALERSLVDTAGAERAQLSAELAEALEAVRSEKLGEVATEYDQVHSIYRAQRVGSVHDILPPARLRPYLIEAIERGMARELDRVAAVK